jgi:membrane-associated phospholipid phosphatase
MRSPTNVDPGHVSANILAGLKIIEPDDNAAIAKRLRKTPIVRAYMLHMTRLFWAWLAGLLITVLLASISVVWFDRPIAILMHDTFGAWYFRDAVTHSPGSSIQLASAFIFVVFGLFAIMGRKFTRLEISVLLCNISVLAADVIKNQLKYVFGRTWPDSWDPQILSYIHDNVYGFNFFHYGRSFESFPSGHAAVAASVISVLWMLFPRLRAVWIICIGAADLGLVLLNLHFVSDVVAGTFVGASTGVFTVTLCASMVGHDQSILANNRSS